MQYWKISVVEKKFREQNAYELQEYKEVSRQLLEWYPDKHLPSVDELEQRMTALMQERSDKNELYRSVSQMSKELAQAQQTIEEFLRQERAVHEQSRKKKKNGDLEWLFSANFMQNTFFKVNKTR